MRPSIPASFADRAPGTGPGPMLRRKLWADTWALARQATALLILVALGVALFVALQESYQNVTIIYDRIYRVTRMADASVLFDRGPASLADRARAIPGVRVAMGRRVADGSIIQRGRAHERVMGRFISLPAGGRSPINDLWLVAGRTVAGPREAVLEQQFARENGYHPGDILKCSYNSREREFTVVGVAASPEYLYPVPSRFAVFVPRGTFGVVWVTEDRAREWFGYGSQINELHCLTAPGQQARVLEMLKALVHSYGLRFAYVQDDQPSKRLLSMDQQGLATMSVFFPILFLGAAGLSLYGALMRIVRLQVTIIGTLRACGFTRAELLVQHVAQGGLITLAGALPGAVLGHLMALGIHHMYVEMLRLPFASGDVHWGTVTAGFIIALTTGLVAALLPARLAAGVPPAMAMRGEIGASAHAARNPLVERLARRVAVFYRIPLRGTLQRASRTLFAIGGVAGGAIIMVTTFGQYVATMSAIDEFLTGSRKYQIDLQLTGPAAGFLAAAADIPGGRAAVRTVSVAVRLTGAHGTGEVMLTGLERGQRLLHVSTASGAPMVISPGVIWVPHRLAGRLRLAAGDPVRVEWEGSSRHRRLRTTLRVAGLLDVAMGNSAYGEYNDIRRSLADAAWPQSGYCALFDCDPELADAFKHRFERSDDVVSVATTADITRDIDQQMGAMFVFIGILLSFGSLLAGSAIQTVASVTVLERTRELATLRSLGFSTAATSWLAGLELFLLAVAGLVLGLPLGALLNKAFMASFQTENMSFRALLPPWVFIVTSVIVLGLVLLAVHSGARRLAAMSLPEATKARE